ncbi:MAG: hypothetical protein ABI183_17400 [Polyangiaceae bacterium]
MRRRAFVVPASAVAVSLFFCWCSLDGLTGGTSPNGGAVIDASFVDHAISVVTESGVSDARIDARVLPDLPDAMLPDGGFDCSVHADAWLFCGNTLYGFVYPDKSYDQDPVDQLATEYSAFECWGTGELHKGGNTTWYRTYGTSDPSNPHLGWVAGVDLKTPDGFDANPTAYGLAPCP